MVLKLLAFDKWARLVRIIWQNGGPFGALVRLWRTDTLKEGKLAGVDCCGNTYYENPYYMIGRSRWVIYNPAVKFEYDASQVSAEWAGWLHYRTDCKPNEDHAKICLMCCPLAHSWLLPHMENLSGSDQAYYPYSTTRAYLHVWNDRYAIDTITYQHNWQFYGQLAREATHEGVEISVLPFYTDCLYLNNDKCFDPLKEFFDKRSKEKGIWYKTIQAEPVRSPWIQVTPMSRIEVVTALRHRSGHMPLNKFAYLMGKAPSANFTLWCGGGRLPTNVRPSSLNKDLKNKLLLHEFYRFPNPSSHRRVNGVGEP